MRSRRILLAPFLVIVLLFAVSPQPVSADITGNHYFFAATWENYERTVDNELIYQHSVDGTFEITVYNLTSSDEYEYNYNGFNYAYGYPHDDDVNDSVDFLDNRVHFYLQIYDTNDNNMSNYYYLNMYPYFTSHHPGNMFFVNPTWETHNADWTDGVENATGYSSVTSITGVAGDGTFTLHLAMNVETIDFVHGNMTGTTTLDFDASYDDDGVLSTWELTRTTSIYNENHTINSVDLEKYSRISARGGGIIFDSSLTTQLLIVGGVGIGCLVLGVVVGKKY
ncbi:MAG: hypothetical protein ACTSUO_05010 [Candidatus Thorarchaeota archaeon]